MQRWIPPASIVLVSTTPILHRDHTLEIPPPLKLSKSLVFLRGPVLMLTPRHTQDRLPRIPISSHQVARPSPKRRLRGVPSLLLAALTAVIYCCSGTIVRIGA